MESTFAVTLPAGLHEFLKEQTHAKGLRSADEYVVELVKAEQERVWRARIDQLLLDGINSGPATPMTTQDWDDIRREGLAS
jgi:antitoxin ParD1/3/4